MSSCSSECKSLEIKVKRLSPEAKLPTKAHQEDAGFDLYSLTTEVIGPHSQKTFKTGVVMSVPAGHYSQFHDRSSMGKRGIKVMGGVIDSGYRSELLVMLNNTSNDDVIIQAGDKIAQFVILPVPTAQIVEVEELDDSERGEKGFGSSGR